MSHSVFLIGNRPISTPRLNTLLCVHLEPINVIISYGSQTISNLEVGFPLRCFQRLSNPDIANQRCPWRDSWETSGQFTPVLSSHFFTHHCVRRLYLHPSIRLRMSAYYGGVSCRLASRRPPSSFHKNGNSVVTGSNCFCISRLPTVLSFKKLVLICALSEGTVCG